MIYLALFIICIPITIVTIIVRRIYKSSEIAFIELINLQVDRLINNDDKIVLKTLIFNVNTIKELKRLMKLDVFLLLKSVKAQDIVFQIRAY